MKEGCKSEKTTVDTILLLWAADVKGILKYLVGVVVELFGAHGVEETKVGQKQLEFPKEHTRDRICSDGVFTTRTSTQGIVNSYFLKEVTKGEVEYGADY